MEILDSAFGEWSRRPGSSRTRASPRQHAFTLPVPNLRSALTTRRSARLFLLLAAALALSALFLSPSPQPVQAQTPAVETRIWSATLTVGASGTAKGYSETQPGLSQLGSLGTDSFTASLFEIGGTGYRVGTLTQLGTQHLRLIVRSNVQGSAQNSQLPAHDYILRVGDSDFTFHGTNDFSGSLDAYQFALSGLSLTDGQTIQVSLWGIGRPSVFGLAVDYDTDNDNLIEVSSLQQLDAIHHDLNGNGMVDSNLGTDESQQYASAFPNAATNMGCSSTCAGYELTVDLDFDTNDDGVVDDGDDYWHGGGGWRPIGGETGYSGEFHGNGYSISNMRINYEGISAGLFGHINGIGFVHHVGLIDASVWGYSGQDNVGILVGKISSNTAAVAASYATGNVWATRYLIDPNDPRGTLTITEGSDYVGGLVGTNGGSVVASWTDVNVTGGYDVGGVIGHNTGLTIGLYALGTVRGSTNVDGTAITHNVHGVVGLNDGGTLNGVYYNSDSHMVADSPYSRTTLELVSPTSYTGIYVNWNVDTDRVGGGDDPWDFGTVQDYPKLKADKNGDGVFTIAEFPGQDQRPPSGDMDYDTDNDKLIEVSSLAQLRAIHYDLNGNGIVDNNLGTAESQQYASAFPNPQYRMGCAENHCTGYELVADLDFDTNGNGRADSGDAYWNGGAGWHPIGNRGSWGSLNAWYSATFDGNGHTISNMYIHRTFAHYLGLFGHVSGHIRNLGMKDAYINGGTRVGIVAGSAGSLVSSTYATGRIVGNGSKVGGLVGELSGHVVATWADVRIETPPYTRPYPYFGGIAGCVYSNGEADGTVKASYFLGSVIETIPSSTSQKWHPVAHLCSGGSDNYEPGVNADSYFDGNRHQESDQWGRSTGQLVSPTDYTGIYANWNVNIRGDSAGDDPWDFGTSRDYPKLKADKNGDGVYTVEEFSGQDQETQGNTVYDTDGDGLIEITSMVQLNAIRFDTDGNGDVLWASAPQYPEAFPDAKYGMGCPENLCSGYELANDIDHDTNGNGMLDGGDWPYDDGAGFRPIGHDDDAPYTTEFNGNGYAIRNLNIDRDAKRVGLFGSIGGSAYIHHVGLNNVNITSTDQSVGDVGALVGFAGGNQTRISANYATGSVTGVNQVGGLVGSNQGIMQANWTNVTVTGNQHVGGLVGHNGGDISASYSRGSASGTTLVHGVVGVTDGGTLAQVYFDSDNHPATTDEVHPKTKMELQEPQGYTGIYSGWNVDLDGDGNADDPWDFGVNIQHPVLKTDRNGDGISTWHEFGYQEREAIQAPAMVSFESPSNETLTVVWDPLQNVLTSYDLRYRVDGAGTWSNGPYGVDDTSATITELNRNTVYEVQVRSSGSDVWSDSAYGATTVNGAVYSAIMTMGGSGSDNRGYIEADYGEISPRSFEYQGTTFTLDRLSYTYALGIQSRGTYRLSFDPNRHLPFPFSLHLDGFILPSISFSQPTSGDYVITVPSGGWSVGQRVAVSIAPYTIQFGETEYSATEGGTIDVSVEISQSDHIERVARYRLSPSYDCYTDDNFRADLSNFEGADGEVSFRNTSGTMPSRQTIQIPIADDFVDEADELACLELYNPFNAVLGSRSKTILKIVDDDAGLHTAWKSLLTAESAKYIDTGYLAPGTGGSFERQENPDGYGSISSKQFTIDGIEYSVIKLATAPDSSSQYKLSFRTEPVLPQSVAETYKLYLIDTSGDKFGGILTRDTSQTNTYSMVGTSAIQPDRKYMVRLQTTPSIGLSENNYRGGENFGSVITSVAISGGSDSIPRSVSYQLADDQHSCNLPPTSPLATPGEDFVVPSGTVTFQTPTHGHAVRTIEIPVQLINDDIDEADEEVFCIEAYNPQNAKLGRAFALMRIMDDDVAKLSIEPVSSNIFPGESANFRINMESEVPSPGSRSVNVAISASNIAGVSTGTRTVELTNLQSTDGVASFEFSVPTGALQSGLTGHVTAELQPSSHPVTSNDNFSYRLHDSLPTTASVQIALDLNPNVWTTEMTAETLNEGDNIGYLMPGYFTDSTFAPGHGSLSEGNQFTINGVDYSVFYIDKLKNPSVMLFRTEPGLPLDGLKYRLHLTSHETGIKSGGRLTRDLSIDSIAYIVPGNHVIEVGHTYTVELTRIIVPEISIEPVHTSVSAGNDAQFRIMTDAPASQRTRVGFEVYEKTYGSDGISFSTIYSTNGIEIPKGQTEAIFRYPTTRGNHARVIEVRLFYGTGYLPSELHPTSATVDVTASSGTISPPPIDIQVLVDDDDDTGTDEDVTAYITYRAQRSDNTFNLNKLVPSGIFDQNYMKRSDGKWVPYEWQWHQTSGPTMELIGYLFVLPDLPHGTKMGFQVAATHRTTGVTKRFDLLLEVVNPGNTEPLSTPVAKAGADVSKQTGKLIQLDGSASQSPTGDWRDLSFQWNVVHAPSRLSDLAFSDEANTFMTSFFMPKLQSGEYLEFELTVAIWGVSDTDTVRVTNGAHISTPQPVSPTACAGPDLVGAPGETVTLQGRCSTNPFGKWHQLSHAWEQLSGHPVTLSSITRGNPSFIIPAGTVDGATFRFKLTVTAENGQSDSDTVVVTVDSTPEATPPTACAGPDLEAQPGDTVTLQGICSTNPHGVWWRMSHLWTQPAGQNIALTNPTKGKPSFTVPSDAVPGTVYTFTLTVTDKDGESDSDDVTVTVPVVTGDSQTVDPPPNRAPVFNDGIALTRSIAENSAAGTTVGAAVTATDPDEDTITYSLSGTDAASFGIGSQTGQITTIEGIVYDFESKNSYSLSVDARDGNGGAASIPITVTLTDVDETPPNSAPTFDDGSETTRSVAENSAAGTNVGAAITASDSDSDTLEYSLSGTDAASFEIDSETGQLTTKSGVTYDFETKNSYSLTVNANDGNGGTAAIAVTVTLTDVDETPPNSAPTFDDGSETTRSVAENSAAGTNVGAAISASDPDSDTLEYSLSGTDAASFEIDSETGQLTTKSGVTYDFEAKNSYSLTVDVDDGNGGTASIAVTVTLTDVDETPPNSAPVFDDGSETTRSVAENSAAGTNVGAAITATDPDEDTLEYSLSGTDSASFEIDSESGQLTTKSGVTYDFEAKNSYSLTVDVDDGNGGTASIAVTVTLTDVDETTPATQVTACFTNLGTLSVAVDYAGSWDDDECRAHHQDSVARYFQFTLAEETVVTITLTPESDGALYVSWDTPQNGWGTEPRSTYEDRRRIRRDNGKLLHDGPHTGLNAVTLTLATGVTYAVEAAGTAGGGTFTISFAPQ